MANIKYGYYGVTDGIAIQKGDSWDITERINNFEFSFVDSCIKTFDIEYRAIVICNENTKKLLLDYPSDDIAPKPYIILTNNEYADNKFTVLQDVDIEEVLINNII